MPRSEFFRESVLTPGLVYLTINCCGNKVGAAFLNTVPSNLCAALGVDVAIDSPFIFLA